jgi:hypothetical protein
VKLWQIVAVVAVGIDATFAVALATLAAASLTIVPVVRRAALGRR